MRLNEPQRKGLANALGDMAAAVIMGLCIALTMSESVSMLTAASMCVFSAILTAISVFLRGTADSGQDD